MIRDREDNLAHNKEQTEIVHHRSTNVRVINFDTETVVKKVCMHRHFQNRRNIGWKDI